MSEYKKPVCFNGIQAMKDIDRLQKANDKLNEMNLKLRQQITNLEIKCRILEERLNGKS